MTSPTDSQSAGVHYDSTSILLHWLTALLVVGLWVVGQTIDWFPKGNSRVIARSCHIATGITLIAIIAYRLVHRSRLKTKIAPAGKGIWPTAALIVHYLLYVLLLTTVTLGVANVWVRGDTFFHLFTVPAFDPGNKELRENVEDLHSLSANVLLIVAGLHAAAGIVHHFLLRDATLKRILPRKFFPQ
jgi:cytochrome b561